jgi:hypothetical protein
MQHHLTLPGPWKQLCKALDVPKMLGGGLAQLMHEDPAQRPTPEVLRTMVLFNRDFFTKAFYEDTLTLLDDCPGSFGSHMLQYACCRPECVKRGLGINGAVVPPGEQQVGKGCLCLLMEIGGGACIMWSAMAAKPSVL